MLFGGNLAEEGKKQFQEPFMPSLRAKHRAPKNVKKTHQGRDKENDDDVIIVEEGTQRKNPQHPGRGKNLHFCQNPVNINPQNDAPDYPMLPDTMEEEFMKSNRVYYILLGDKNKVSRCQGCNLEITECEKASPHNMVFLYKMCRPQPPPNGHGKWILSNTRLNCYFHARNLGCLHQVCELADTKLEHLYMFNKHVRNLKKENIEELERRGHWEPLLENRQWVQLMGKPFI